MSVSRVLCASFFAGALALGVIADLHAPAPAGAAPALNCAPQEAGDYSPALMERLSAEDGMKVIPLPQGQIAMVPQGCGR